MDGVGCYFVVDSSGSTISVNVGCSIYVEGHVLIRDPKLNRIKLQVVGTDELHGKQISDN